MVKEISSTQKGELFPKKAGSTNSSKTEPAKVTNKSIEQNDPNTSDFVKKHTVQKWDHREGDGDGVFTAKNKKALDDPKNARMRPKEGVYEEQDIEEKYIGFD